MMNINHLKYFCSVCAFQTVSDAAEYLHISQPSLSSAIKTLEKEFGVVLFKRHHGGMLLTAEGEILYKMSKDIVTRTEQLENVMKDLGRERKKLRLGIPPMIGSLILPGIYRDFLPKHEEIKLEIKEGSRQELTQKLEEDYLDMIFVPHNRALGSDLSSMQVAKLEVVCCAAQNSPFLKKTCMAPSDFKGTPVVLFEDSFFQTEEIKKWFAEGGVKPDILLQTRQLSTMLNIVSNNMAVGFMFRHLIEANEEYVSVPISSPMYMEVSLVWKKGTYAFSSMQKFKEYINENNPFYGV